MKSKRKTKAVYVYDLNGEYVKTYSSIKSVAEELGCKPVNIYKATIDERQISSLQFRYEKFDKIEPYRRSTKAVYSYDFNGCYVAMYDSVKDAAKELMCNPNDVYQAIINECQVSGLQFRYEKFDKIEPYKKQIRNRSAAVYSYDLNGNYVATYDDIAAAAKELGCKPSNISYAVWSGGTTSGLQFRREKFDKVAHCKHKNMKSVYAYDVHGAYVRSYDGIISVCNILGKKRHTITAAISKKRLIADLQFRYEKFDKIEPYEKIKPYCINSRICN